MLRTYPDEVFSGDFVANEFLSLPRGTVIDKLQEDGRAGIPFRGTVDRCDEPGYGRRDAIIRASRARYARPRKHVEPSITRFLAS